MNMSFKKSNLVEIIIIIILLLFGVFLSCDSTTSKKISPISSVPELPDTDGASPPLPAGFSDVHVALIKLKDKDASVRYYAAFALSIIKDKQSVEPLITSLKDKALSVRAEAAYALGIIRDLRAVEPLITALKDENSDVRKESARALGKMKDVRAVEPLITALKDENSDVRIYAAYSLVAIRDERAVEPLMEALKNENLEIVAGGYRFFLHIGVAGSENKLIKSFYKYGYMIPDMAPDFLNCGNNQLKESAIEWAKFFNYIIVPTGGQESDGLHWGGGRR